MTFWREKVGLSAPLIFLYRIKLWHLCHQSILWLNVKCCPFPAVMSLTPEQSEICDALRLSVTDQTFAKKCTVPLTTDEEYIYKCYDRWQKWQMERKYINYTLKNPYIIYLNTFLHISSDINCFLDYKWDNLTY